MATHREIAARLYPLARLIDTAPIHPPTKETHSMTTATHLAAVDDGEQPGQPDDPRAEMIAGLRELADFLEQHPGLPAPQYVFARATVTGDNDEAKRAEFIRAIRVAGPDRIDRSFDDVDAVRELSGGVRYIVSCPERAAVTRRVDMEQTTDGVMRRVEIVEEPDWEALGVPA